MNLDQLYQSLSERRRPEDVAEWILEVLGDHYSNHERRTLYLAAKNALKHNFWGYSSMLQQFKGPVGADRQVTKANELFKLEPDPEADYSDPEQVRAYLERVSPLLNKEVGMNNFVQDRLNRVQREAMGMDISKRQYNKRWRLLKRTEARIQALIREHDKYEFTLIAKHGLVHHLSSEDFSAYPFAAAFIAYYTARCNLRSEFTISGQQKPYDTIADMLFRKCENEGQLPGAAWAIAQVYPHPRVLAFLDDPQKGRLLGKWTEVLQSIAEYMESVWSENSFRIETMIVKRGDDSSTWNQLAGAWNKARDSWINLVYSLGLEDLLDEMCFGKALRLMAADVVAWHMSAGGGLDPNTQVWATLPLPWEVFSGKATCNRQMVRKACREANIDPEKTGWIAPRPHGIAVFRPTPELVHGVTVHNPFLAKVLKQHKYYSGKAGAKPLHPDEN